MFFFVIPPLAHMDLADNAMKAVFCLAHYCLPEHNKDYKRYIEFFQEKQEQGYFVLMDNGAAEQSSVNMEELVKLVALIKPTEVVAPDVLYDANKTVHNLNLFLQLMTSKDLIKQTRVMAVPQGMDSIQWVACYMHMLNNSLVSTVGLSKFSVPACFAVQTDSPSISVNRRYLIRSLFNFGLIKKPFHMLGMRSITEFLAYRNAPLIRSTDSAFTILAAIHGKILSPKEVLNDIGETPKDYFTTELTEKQTQDAILNIGTFAQILGCKI